MGEEQSPNQSNSLPPSAQSESYPQADLHKSANFEVSDKDTASPVQHSGGEHFAEFNENKGKSVLPSVVVWLTFVLSVLFTGYFWLSDYSNVKAISEKESEKNSIVSQLNSENNKKTETEAINFKSAFQQLSTLTTNRVSKADFLTAFYTHLTRDVKISSFSLSGEGELGLDGATGSYRQVADLMLGLTTYDKLSEVSLKKVSVSTEEGVAANQKIVFGISAKADLTKTPSVTAVDNSATSGAEGTTP